MLQHCAAHLSAKLPHPKEHDSGRKLRGSSPSPFSIEKIALVIADIIATFIHPTLHHFLMHLQHFQPLSYSTYYILFKYIFLLV
jgi:hypothetical protein